MWGGHDEAEQVEDIEERNRRLQEGIDKIMATEQQAKKQQASLDSQVEHLRQELSAAHNRIQRVQQIRNTCKRLSCVEGKLHPLGAKKASCAGSPGCAQARVLGRLLQVTGWCLAMAAAIFASMLTYTYIQGEPEKICRPSNQPVQLHVGTQPFDPHFPPLLSQGQKIVNQSQMVTWGEASLHVCSRGTAEQSFLRRDDCDGCMCPLGSLWMPYKDPRFFGNGEFCVPEKQWKDCISRWSCCKNKPNYCWDFIFDGARQDPKSQDYCVVVDSCSHHMACYSMIRRRRRWELAREFRPSADTHLTVDLVVGVPLAQMEEVKARLNMDANIRGWGLPSSVLQLIKVASTTSPQEWKPQEPVAVHLSLKGGKRYKMWQMVSYYSVTAKSMSGDEFTMAEFTQHEHISYLDAAS